MFALLCSLAVAAPWTASGPGTVHLLSDGTVDPASVQYFHDADGSGAPILWELSTTADAAGTLDLDWNYEGFAAYFRVRMAVRGFVTHDGSTTETALVTLGPEDCCDEPSEGFWESGTYTVTVAAGDVVGFRFGSNNNDSNPGMSGWFEAGGAAFTTNDDDACKGTDSTGNTDVDGDGVPYDGWCDDADFCVGSDFAGDSDDDGVCDDIDLCDGDDAADADADGVPDACDLCEGDDAVDTDSDGVPDTCDACPDDGDPCPGGDTGDTGDADDDGGCGCDGTGGPAKLGALVGLALLLRRRR